MEILQWRAFFWTWDFKGSRKSATRIRQSGKDRWFGLHRWPGNSNCKSNASASAQNWFFCWDSANSGSRRHTRDVDRRISTRQEISTPGDTNCIGSARFLQRRPGSFPPGLFQYPFPLPFQTILKTQHILYLSATCLPGFHPRAM